MNIGLFFATAFWISFALSPGLAVWGVWRADRWILFASAVISIPFTFVIVAHPATRYFAVLPVLHIIAAIQVRSAFRWLSWLMLALIAALSVWFLIVRFG
jgi:hypothetical protein